MSYNKTKLIVATDFSTMTDWNPTAQTFTYNGVAYHVGDNAFTTTEAAVAAVDPTTTDLQIEAGPYSGFTLTQAMHLTASNGVVDLSSGTLSLGEKHEEKPSAEPAPVNFVLDGNYKLNNFYSEKFSGASVTVNGDIVMTGNGYFKAWTNVTIGKGASLTKNTNVAGLIAVYGVVDVLGTLSYVTETGGTGSVLDIGSSYGVPAILRVSGEDASALVAFQTETAANTVEISSDGQLIVEKEASFTAGGSGIIDNAGSITVDGTSTLTAKKIANSGSLNLTAGNTLSLTDITSTATGTITVDASAATADLYKIIDYTGTGTKTLADYGTVTITGTGYTKAVSGNDLYIMSSQLKPEVEYLSVARSEETVETVTTEYATFRWVVNGVDPAFISGYTISIKEGSGDYVDYNVGTENSYKLAVKNNTTYTYKVTAATLVGATNTPVEESLTIYDEPTSPAATPKTSEATTETTWDTTTKTADQYMLKLTKTTVGGSPSTSVLQLETRNTGVNIIGLNTPEDNTTFAWKTSISGLSASAAPQDASVAAVSRENPTVLTSAYDGSTNTNDDAFFAQASGSFSGLYSAHNMVSGQYHSISGMNKFTDVFAGGNGNVSSLFLTDSGNDAFFLDDIYSAAPTAEQTARFTNLNMIHAGDGDDLVDLTSARFVQEVGKPVSVHGGDGADTIWGSNGNDAMLFGDGGNDNIQGGTGNDFIIGGTGSDTMAGNGGSDTFVFGETWGVDTVNQTADGAVTLWFASGDMSHWDSAAKKYTLNDDNTVTVTGTDNITLKFGNDGTALFINLSDAGAFDTAQEDTKIFATVAG